MNNPNNNHDVTKEDFNQFRLELYTKLSTFATKDDLKSFVTKDEFSRLEKTVDNMAAAIVNMQANNETKADAEKKFNILLNAIEGLAKRIDIFNTEKAAQKYTFQLHEKKLTNHDTRIKKLETTLDK